MGLIRNKRKCKVTSHMSIGIIGTQPGVGVTHLSLCLANYLCSAKKYRVNYIEICDKSSIYELLKENGIYIGDESCYKFKGVNYYPDSSVALAKRLIFSENAINIVDISHMSLDTISLAMVCTRFFVIGSLKPWCKENYQAFLHYASSIEVDMRRFKYRTGPFDEELADRFSRENHIVVKSLPVLSDPFRLKPSGFDVLENILL